MRSIADHAAPQSRDRTERPHSVMRGLDPRIHPSSHESFEEDGCRVKPGNGGSAVEIAFPGKRFADEKKNR
jgi:hypothetical protein